MAIKFCLLTILALPGGLLAQDVPKVTKSNALPGLSDTFASRVSDFDKGMKAVLGKAGNVDSYGNVAKNLSSDDIALIRQLANDKLGVGLSNAEAKLLADKIVVDARQAGPNWRNTLSAAKLYQTGSAAHGFVAESINYDDLRSRYPRVQFTRPASRSADLVAMDEVTGRPIVGIQTKAINTAKGSLASGALDAQAFYADKPFSVPYEVYIPKDQFEASVKAGLLSADGKQLKPDIHLKQLANRYEQALKNESPKPESNDSRLRQITKVHGDVSEFDREVLDRMTVRPLSQTYDEVQKTSTAMAEMRKSFLEQSAYKAYLDSLPSDFQAAKNAGLVAGALTAFAKLWQEGVSKESVEDALKEGCTVGAKAFGSTYLASGIMRRYGSRIVFRTWLDIDSMNEKQINAFMKTLPEMDRSLLANQVVGTAFLATFIFDETGTILSLSAGDISGQEFMLESGKNIVKSSAGAAVAWGAVMLGAAPGGLVVTAVVIGTQIIVSKALDAIEAYEARKHLSLRDFIGTLPESIRNRVISFSSTGPSPLEPQPARLSPLEPPPGKLSPLEPPSGRPSPF